MLEKQASKRTWALILSIHTKAQHGGMWLCPNAGEAERRNYSDVLASALQSLDAGVLNTCSPRLALNRKFLLLSLPPFFCLLKTLINIYYWERSACHSMCVEVRGQICGVGSLPPYVPGIKSRLPDLHIKPLGLLSHLACPLSLPFSNLFSF